jgi:hypothetical protein
MDEKVKTTSVRFQYRPSTKKGIRSRGSIYIRFIRDRQTRELNTRFRVFPDEWDDKKR